MAQRPGVSTLWLPLAAPRVAWGAVLVTALLYLATMARGIGFYDSGELAVAGYQLGLGHPPGQPVYTLVAWLFSHLPGLSPALGLDLLSALCGALTVLPVLSIAEHMLPDQARYSREVAIWTALAAVALSQHAALWEQSTRIELYALAALLALWCLARLAHVLELGASSEGYLVLGGVLGTCAAVNPVMAAFAALSGLPGVVRALRRRRLSLANFGWLAGGAALGLVPYVYVPLIAERTDRFVWGAPTRGAALVDYLTVRDFRVNVGVPLGRMASQVGAWLGFASDAGILPLWIIGLSAHVMAPAGMLTRLCAPVATLLAALYLGSYAVFRPDVPDCVSYASIATWLCAAGCAGLVGSLWGRGSRLSGAALALALTLATAIAPPLLFSRTRHVGDPARELATSLLESLPQRTLLVAGSDHWIAPLWYLQEVERRRPDVVVVAVGLLNSSWYFEHLYRRHPELARIVLQGPGGSYGRLSRLLNAQPGRPIAFEAEADAHAVGLTTCLGPVFAHARVPCVEASGLRTRFTRQLAALTRRTDAGEPTVMGVVSGMALARARMLANHGFTADALEALFAGIDPVLAPLDARVTERVAALSPRPLDVPAWQKPVALGDPARNLYLAARLAGRAGDTQHAVVWLMLARDLGLPEAEQVLADIARADPAQAR